MLTVFTIVLNGEPWIRRILPELQKLSIPWEWRICEGVGDPHNCTSWCRPVPARWHCRHRSVDGTTEYLDSILGTPGVTVSRQDAPYFGKLHMIREALGTAPRDVVVQLDADELFTVTQLESIYQILLPQPAGTRMQFYCNYWVGPAKKIVTRTGYGSMPYEWMRAWRWGEGVHFTSHEPPALNATGQLLSRGLTQDLGLLMDHRAYATREQAAFKEDYYGYDGLVGQWERLQKTSGPVRLSRFFNHVKDAAVADDA